MVNIKTRKKNISKDGKWKEEKSCGEASAIARGTFDDFRFETYNQRALDDVENKTKNCKRISYQLETYRTAILKGYYLFLLNHIDKQFILPTWGFHETIQL